jgi:hypothetical protein
LTEARALLIYDSIDDNEKFLQVAEETKSLIMNYPAAELRGIKMNFYLINPNAEHRGILLIKVCEHVLSIPLTKEEVQYEAKLSRYRALPKWLRWTMPGFEFRMRCKWCGRYIRYIHPDVPTFGFDTLANSCLFCSRMYPMPSWMWDSPDGRAYSYYRMSFSGDDFYKEFEQGYDPTPLCQHRRK